MENSKSFFAKKFNLQERDIVPEFIPFYSIIDSISESQKAFFSKYKAEIKQITFSNKKEAIFHGAAATFLPSIVVLVIFSVLYFTWYQKDKFQTILDYNSKYPQFETYAILMQNAKIEHLKNGDFIRLQPSKTENLSVGENYKFEEKTNSILIPLVFKSN